jgi:DNA-binding NtrC family response regulator/tetratricopeptide (TPR) repeat protein
MPNSKAKGRSASGRDVVAFPAANMDALFRNVGQKLREGLSGAAEKLLRDALAKDGHSPDDLANLRRLLSFTLETTGRYRESLEAIAAYESTEMLAALTDENRIKITAQLAIAHNNTGDQPKAATLLKEARKRSEEADLRHLLGTIDIALARVYRKLNEFPICRDHAERALNDFRSLGNWLGMAEAYREIANSYHQEGESEKAIENFRLGIEIIGDNSAPFMLGKLYTDMSGAYWFLRRPKEGIACLERSIEFFDRTEHALNSVIAYNNLGINLILIGEWDKAETMILRALAIAEKEGSSHVAGIYDSLGELKILRGELEAAERDLRKAVDIANERNHKWYVLQTLRNLARLYLHQNKPEKALETANSAIALSAEIGDKHYANMAGLVLAEANLVLRDAEACSDALRTVEDNAPDSDFFVLGSIQRIRGLLAARQNDIELAIHHFSRGLTIFETAQDLYHTGLMHSLLGTHIDGRNYARARRHLESAIGIFRKLGLADQAAQMEKRLADIAETAEKQPRSGRTNSVVSQLLTVRLAEATASRELLFRELVAVLQQDSNAKKIIVAQENDQKRLYPFITHGLSPAESNELVNKLNAAGPAEDRAFERSKNVAVLRLRGTSSPPAVLILSPRSGAELADGTSLDPLLRVVELGMDVIALREGSRRPGSPSGPNSYISNSLMPGFIHSSPAMTALVEEVYKIRSSDVTVLVTGESGTGKELVSRAIHKLSNRKDEAFIPFNCTLVQKEMAEATLFGYRKGSFTGAVQDSPGLIRSADGGTLFLDEVGDLPLDIQPKLLRFLQEGEIQPIGEKAPIKVDVRIIAATNMPLEEKVAEGKFREDLFYRLNVIRLRVPPLRERRAEIPPIVNYYINHYSERFGKHDISITPQAIDVLMVCNWEGNVRQLQNEIQRIVARAEDGEVITPAHISPDLKPAGKPLASYAGEGNFEPIASYEGSFTPFANIPTGGTLEEAVSELEMQLIRASLARHNWNISRVASELGLTRRGLYLKLTRYGISKAA